MADQDTMQAPLGTDDIQALERLTAVHARIRAEVAKVIVGQDAVVNSLLMEAGANNWSAL